MTHQEKLDFLKNTFTKKLRQLYPSQKGQWGVLHGQEMIEHFIDSVQWANGTTPQKLVTPIENLERIRAFMLSDKPFKENTPNSLMSDVPPALIYSSVEEALEQLEKEFKLFEEVYTNEPGKKITNPFFGDLNFEEYTHLLHKHALHHLRQFQLID